MPISPEDRAKLVALARSGVHARVMGANPPPLGKLDGVLTEITAD